MKSAAIAFLAICALLLSACGSTPTPEPVQIDAAERTVLAEILYSTGITVDELKPTSSRALGSETRAIAVENGHIVGLRLSETKWPNLGALPRLPNLRILWLSNNGLTDVSGISGLPLLEELILDDNLLTSLDLRDLPALRSVSVRHNQLPTVPDLGPGVTVNVEGNPAQAILDNPHQHRIRSRKASWTGFLGETANSMGPSSPSSVVRSSKITTTAGMAGGSR